MSQEDLIQMIATLSEAERKKIAIIILAMRKRTQ
jgi:hypothetical protein